MQFPPESASTNTSAPWFSEKFLNDFSDGRQTFSLDDFSGRSKERKLSAITLAYAVTGAPDVRSWLTSVPPTIPQEVSVNTLFKAAMPPGWDEEIEPAKTVSHESDDSIIIRPLCCETTSWPCGCLRPALLRSVTY